MISFDPMLLDLEQRTMTRIRPKRQRQITFEALEGRLVLSAGLKLASPHAHALVVRTLQRSLSASFKGHVTITGSTAQITNLTGKIGKDHFGGSGSGTLAGTLFQGGSVFLSNNKGAIQLELGAANVVQVGKKTRQMVPVTVVAATGKYALFVNGSGILNKWNVPVKPSATATFSGTLNA
jgi:hypothetical protein